MLPLTAAAMTTEVPVVQEPPSRLYSVLVTPGLALEKLSVTSLACQALSAPETVVVGAVVTMLTVDVLAVSWLPTVSVER